MKVLLSMLAVFGTLTWLCWAQDPGSTKASKLSGSDISNQGAPNTDQAAYYATLNRRLVEFKAQSDLLSQLAQEHAKRATEISGDPQARALWERELAKELNEKSGVLLGLLNNVRKERLAFEQTHPDLASTVASSQLAGATPSRNADEIAFLQKLDERLAIVQQEIADAAESGRIYTEQLATNTGSADFSRIASLLQDNSNAARQLQKEAADLELKKLEFRALRGN